MGQEHTEEEFRAMFKTERDSREFEQKATGVSRQMLPRCAAEALDGKPTSLYWAWLIGQLHEEG